MAGVVYGTYAVPPTTTVPVTAVPVAQPARAAPVTTISPAYAPQPAAATSSKTIWIVLGVILLVVVIIGIIIAIVASKKKKNGTPPLVSPPVVLPPMTSPAASIMTLPIPDGTQVRMRSLATNRHLSFVAPGQPETLGCFVFGVPLNPPGLSTVGFLVADAGAGDADTIWTVGFSATKQSEIGRPYTFYQDQGGGAVRMLCSVGNAGIAQQVQALTAPGLQPVNEMNVGDYSNDFFFNITPPVANGGAKTNAFRILAEKRVEPGVIEETRFQIFSINSYYNPGGAFVPDCQAVLSTDGSDDAVVPTLLGGDFYLETAA